MPRRKAYTKDTIRLTSSEQADEPEGSAPPPIIVTPPRSYPTVTLPPNQQLIPLITAGLCTLYVIAGASIPLPITDTPDKGVVNGLRVLGYIDSHLSARLLLVAIILVGMGIPLVQRAHNNARKVSEEIYHRELRFGRKFMFAAFGCFVASVFIGFISLFR